MAAALVGTRGSLARGRGFCRCAGCIADPWARRRAGFDGCALAQRWSPLRLCRTSDSLRLSRPPLGRRPQWISLLVVLTPNPIQWNGRVLATFASVARQACADFDPWAKAATSTEEQPWHAVANSPRSEWIAALFGAALSARTLCVHTRGRGCWPCVCCRAVATERKPVWLCVSGECACG